MTRSIGETAVALHKLARECGPDEFRGRALALARDALAADFATWASAVDVAPGDLLPIEVILDRLPTSIVGSFRSERWHGASFRCARRNEGLATILNSVDRLAEHNEITRSAYRDFEIRNTITTARRLPGSSLVQFLSFVRSKRSRTFDASDSERKGTIALLLDESWMANIAWTGNAGAASAGKRGAWALCGTGGLIRNASPEFVDLVGSELRSLAPESLPADMVRPLLAGRPWSGKNIRLSARPVGDSLLLTAAPARARCQLTARELEVASHAARGLSYKRIARETEISPSTVRTHLHNVYAKLGADNKGELGRLIAMLNGGAADELTIRSFN
jgi:DNA-binding CsgD family transcriptional regulator